MSAEAIRNTTHRKEDTDMKTNRTITAILTLALLVSCTAAFAGDTAPKNSGGKKFAHGHHGIHKMKAQLSAEDKAQFEKLHTLAQQLGEEMKKTSPDKTKAMELKKQIEDVRVTMSQKHFEKMLNNPNFGRHKSKLTDAQKARFKKMRELRSAIKEEFVNGTPDKAKVIQLNNELLSLKKEASLERFEYMLNNPDKCKAWGKAKFGHGKRHGFGHRHCRGKDFGHGHCGKSGSTDAEKF